MPYKNRFIHLFIMLILLAVILFVIFLLDSEDGQAKTIEEPYTITVPREVKATPEPTPEVSRGNYDREDILLIAKLIWEEARGESYEGMVAVGEVVLNRVEYDAWSDSVQGVIYQEGQFAHISGKYNETTLKAAVEAVSGSNEADGAQYFFNPDKCSPGWAKKMDKVCRVGGHVFYRRP